ncbi:hypothetical protein [Methanobacterium sp.]
MAEEKRECELCHHIGRVNVIEALGTKEKFWDCPACGRRNISES